MAAPRFLREHAGALSSIALVVTWSSGFVGAELGARAHAMPLTLLSWRFVVLAALLVVVVGLRRTSWPTWRAWRRQAVLGVLCQAAYLVFIFEGVTRGVPGGTAALIAALQPLLVATVAGSLLGEHSSPRMWLGMFLGLVGVAVVVSGDLGVSDAPLWAYLLPTAGMLCLASGTVLSRRVRPPESVLETIMMQSVVTAVLLMVLAVAFGQSAPPASLEFWRAVAWLIVLASLGGYVMYVFVARTQGATVVSTLLFLTPPTTMFWVYLMFGERVTVTGLVGLAVSGVGVWLVLGRRRVQGPIEAPVEDGVRRT
ncbi:MAG: EamA/RhaT family transporter [Marmoricola sp.]|nr:EamA/RhaT family transporter [Marmoricola sp.]